jgi:acyl-CoA reductase-like NAD-dependent aldehyde dehydrogenase
MNDEIVPELAWQMGRPVRYGGERRREERTRYMVRLPRMRSRRGKRQGRLPALCEEGTARRGAVIAPWNYPYLTAVNTIVPGIGRRKRRDPETCRADPLWAAAVPTGLDTAGLPGLFKLP